MKRIALIPARSGSKGVPDKNIIDLCGKPLIVYAIEEAKKTGLFEHIFVTTDSEKYAEIARRAGAEVMMRSAELSSDTASTYDVIVDFFQNRYKEPCDYFVLLQVTSPMRTATHIKEACEMYDARAKGIEYVVSVKRSETCSSFIFPIEKDNTLKHFHYDESRGRRQDYDEYCVNGAIYISEPFTYIKSQTFFGPTSIAYKMNAVESLDIDTWLDYDLATLLMQKRKTKEENK